MGGDKGSGGQRSAHRQASGIRVWELWEIMYPFVDTNVGSGKLEVWSSPYRAISIGLEAVLVLVVTAGVGRGQGCCYTSSAALPRTAPLTTLT